MVKKKIEKRTEEKGKENAMKLDERLFWKYIFSLFQLHDRYKPVCLIGDYISYVEYISYVHWPLAKLHNIDRETRKVISEKGGRHSLSYKPILYLARETGGRGLLSVQEECKLIKSRSAI